MLFIFSLSLLAFPFVLAFFFGSVPVNGLAVSSRAGSLQQIDLHPSFITMNRRSIWNPQVTSPEAGTTWKIGTQVVVTWNTSNKPAHVTNDTGKLVLGHIENNSEAENLDFEHPLASGFPLYSGSIQVQVPNVPNRNDYIVVLLGDSGNTSPKFTIA